MIKKNQTMHAALKNKIKDSSKYQFMGNYWDFVY